MFVFEIPLEWFRRDLGLWRLGGGEEARDFTLPTGGSLIGDEAIDIFLMARFASSTSIFEPSSSVMASRLARYSRNRVVPKNELCRDLVLVVPVCFFRHDFLAIGLCHIGLVWMP